MPGSALPFWRAFAALCCRPRFASWRRPSASWRASPSLRATRRSSSARSPTFRRSVRSCWPSPRPSGRA
eukprot:9901613-Alexandrium_andersonii.AAC.1